MGHHQILMPNVINNSSNMSHLILKIGDLQNTYHIYICTTPCNPSDIKMYSKLNHLTYNHYPWKLHGIINIPWEENDITVTSYDIGMKMPNIAYISPFYMRGVHELIKRDNYVIRLIINGNGFKSILA